MGVFSFPLFLTMFHFRCPHSFNLPRISARLERLMGTNVVKLTDRTYMKQLRDRIDEDYRQQLDARIRSREVSSRQNSQSTHNLESANCLPISRNTNVTNLQDV